MQYLRNLLFFISALTFHATINSDDLQLQVDSKLNTKKAVTYDLGGGRFGDKFLGYLHAKWLSYKYKMPLLYKPFPYSDQLALHFLEKKYTSVDPSNYKQIITPAYGMNVNYAEDRSALFIIPYFPENLWEHKPPNNWYYFKVDWDDPGFLKIIRKMIRPLYFTPSLPLPTDRITVAVHVRKGGGFDTENTWRNAALKLPPDSYYIDQIKRIINIYEGQPLYIYIFTDDQNPPGIVEKYKQYFIGKNIEFGCRTTGNHHTSNVLEDFFNMMRFDCLIRPDSNYSIIVSKVGKFKVLISPLHFQWTGDTGYVDEVEVVFSKGSKGCNTREIIHVLD